MTGTRPVTWQARCRRRIAAWRLAHRYPSGRMTQAQLERWAEDAIAAQAPDRVEQLERRVAHLAQVMSMVAVMLTTCTEQMRDSVGFEDIRCPVCRVRYNAEHLREHIADLPANCNRIAWDSNAHPRALTQVSA